MNSIERPGGQTTLGVGREWGMPNRPQRIRTTAGAVLAALVAAAVAVPSPALAASRRSQTESRHSLGVIPPSIPVETAPSTTVVSTPSPSVPTTVAAPLAPTPQEYLKIALDFIDQYAYRTSTSDWATIRRDAEGRGAAAAAYTDIHPIVADVLKAIGDNHSSFQRPVQASQLRAGVYEGFGFVAVWPTRVVAQVSRDSPAEKGGLRVGDKIEKVDGKAPPHNDRLIVIARDKVGELPKKLQLTVSRPRRKGTFTMTLARGIVSTVNAPESSVIRTPTTPSGFGYLEVPGIVGDSAAQQNFARQMHDVIRVAEGEGRCGWIVDLRENRGGYMFPMLVGVGPLVGDGMLAGKVDAKGVVERWEYSAGAVTSNGRLVFSTPDPYIPGPALAGRPVAVLVSNLTASAAEATTLAFVGRPNTRIFGQNTVGLTHFTVMRALPDTSLVIVTNAIDIDRQGRRYDGPLTVDQPYVMDWSKYQASDDPGILAATNWLSAQPGCTNPPAPPQTPTPLPPDTVPALVPVSVVPASA